MVDLAEKFAVDLMQHTGDERKREAGRNIVKYDVATARGLVGQPFFLSYNTDRRGRVYAIPRFNFGREGHVRAMFKFASGLPLGDRIKWLEVHCANCWGEDKESFQDRVKWIDNNRETISAVASDPVFTFEEWRKADEPLAYVAACRELAQAWGDPDGFVTRLSVGFDGSCNGIQHLALLSGDAVAGRRVNLVDGNKPEDIYREVKRLVAVDGGEDAKQWRDFFETATKKDIRKLVKQPGGTFASPSGLVGSAQDYAVELRSGPRSMREAEAQWPVAH